MKRYIFLSLFAVTFAAQAQDPYMNERITNNSSDVIGTARYVGMGGALGALGADMSVISWNPAGIGLYRKSDIALTFGGIWGKSHINEENRGKATFDQAGFVYNMKTGSETVPYVNFAFNFQKKINFNHNFYADNGNLGGLSQMDQLAQLTEYYEAQDYPYNLTELALANNGGDWFFDSSDLSNPFRSYSNYYTHHSEGSLQSFDFNLSTNINNRAFLGLTIGVDNMRYRGWNDYVEVGSSSYGLYDYDIHISGTGVNVKLGTIFHPIADNPFRLGFVIETPTWYRLKRASFFNFYDADMRTSDGDSYFKFNIRSPWKFRTSIGSTVGSTLAWDVDYEFADYVGMSMGYPEFEDDWDGSTSGNIKDVDMNRLSRKNLRGTHTLRTGIEVNATKNLAFRLGYNLSTSAYEKDINLDQYNLNSYARDYSTSTSFMRMGTTNILTLGVGYHIKSFYIDLAYKIRNQNADFYAFDTSFTDSQYGDPIFLNNNTTLADAKINPVGVDLTRHAITCTLGFKIK